MRAEFSPQLKQLYTRRDQLRRRMEAIRADVEERLDLPGKVSLDHTTCHLRITNRDEHRARLSAPYEVVDSKKDGTRFTLPTLRVLGREYKSVVAMYGELQRVYERRLIETTLTYGVAVERMCAVIAELDVMLAFAHVAASVDGYVRPVMREAGSGVLRMEGSRHPLLEQLVTGGIGSGVGGEGEANGVSLSTFIPNDVELVAGKSHCQIITGPNSGQCAHNERPRAFIHSCLYAADWLCGCVAADRRQVDVHSTDRRDMLDGSDRSASNKHHPLLSPHPLYTDRLSLYRSSYLHSIRDRRLLDCFSQARSSRVHLPSCLS